MSKAVRTVDPMGPADYAITGTLVATPAISALGYRLAVQADDRPIIPGSCEDHAARRAFIIPCPSEVSAYRIVFLGIRQQAE